jgi:hypothetical protein
MAPQTQGTDVIEIALPAALGHRHNMIRIPKALPRARLQPPMLKERFLVHAPRISQPPRLSKRIDVTA